MRNFFIFLILVVAGVKYGTHYLLSDDFQEYANRTKAPWTCKFENVVGHLHMVMSDYDAAREHFDHTIKRCPDSPQMEEAMFERARCVEAMGDVRSAVALYNEFAEKYPGTKRARIALRAADMIRVN